LPVLVVSSIVQILWLACCFIDHGVARIAFVDAMLLNQLHGLHLLLLLIVVLILSLFYHYSTRIRSFVNVCLTEFWQHITITLPPSYERFDMPAKEQDSMTLDEIAQMRSRNCSV
jgi:hypothetical protein